MLEYRPAGAAVFLKIGKHEEFYIRSGPLSTNLIPCQTVSFMAEKQEGSSLLAASSDTPICSKTAWAISR